ncbi:hypothetical protein EGW08_018042 [Elysia chlorotica]|uniref:Uncharacterized protein n=1 Tax=Elysia chlorotica TaxID=188477 RepID=A0A3S0ZSI4_ELYCH|nr:hypothetical protein EGW08_018042 [Elysia chlorotica]
MAKAGDFEQLIKMNRLPPPSVLNSPLPVKFREVRFDPEHSDDRRKEQIVTEPQPTSQLLTGHVFFKDPLCPPELADYDKEESGSEGVIDLMNERKKILYQQKEQQAEFSREADSDQLAAVLVNDLMQQGFHITPPEQTPRGKGEEPTNLPSLVPSFSLDATNKDKQTKQNVTPEGIGELVSAIHREVKKVTCSDNTEEPL